VTEIYNINNIPEDYIDDPQFKSLMKTLYLGFAGGSEKLYVNIDYVKPGGKSVKYHSHSSQEEFFLILNGKGLLRLDGNEFCVQKGDFFSKPAGRGISHQFINDGDDALEILDCGLRVEDDVITYPDDDVILLKKDRKAFRLSDEYSEWSSDPNE